MLNTEQVQANWTLKDLVSTLFLVQKSVVTIAKGIYHTTYYFLLIGSNYNNQIIILREQDYSSWSICILVLSCALHSSTLKISQRFVCVS